MHTFRENTVCCLFLYGSGILLKFPGTIFCTRIRVWICAGNYRRRRVSVTRAQIRWVEAM